MKIYKSWEKVINNPIELEVLTKVLPTKGKLVYEYNPFRNYRLSKSMYEYQEGLYTLEDLELTFGITLSSDKKVWLNLPTTELPILRESGELTDFITDELQFSLENPVNIIPLYSYDGSVNLIINDGVNIPRLINSRFSATGRNTYEIIDRKGNNDTNIYDLGDQFNIDTSLYKRIVSIPKIKFVGIDSGGNLKVGNYHFYFKLSDADGNETDFVGESGLVSIFIGFNDPSSINSGVKNENSFKSVKFKLSEIDRAYDNISVYYSRYTAEGNENYVTQYIKIDRQYKVDNAGKCSILITGFEHETEVSPEDINLNYNIVNSSFTLAQCLNMLFLANVHKLDIPYKELADLSLRFLPFLNDTTYPLAILENYFVESKSYGYYDPVYIYNNTGYWDKEIYRLGIVYILPNNELTPVFNIRGANHIVSFLEDLYTNIPLFDNEGARLYVTYDESSYLVIPDKGITLSTNITEENVKGVVRFESNYDSNTVHGLDIRVDNDTITELKKYVKGYFFVRQSRIPTILALGITLGIDNQSRTPTIPTKGGIIDSIKSTQLEQTYVVTDDIDGVNYISEGFLSRYKYELKAKGSFMNILSTAVSFAATICSFVPGIGTVASVALNAASFITSTIATGKFLLAAFVSTVMSSLPAVGAAMSTVGKAVKEGEKISKIQKILNKVAAVGVKLNKLEKVLSFTNVIKISNSIQTAYNTYETAKLISNTSKGASYSGRFTEVPSRYERKELGDSRVLSGTFEDRFIMTSPSRNKNQAILCPDYTINLPYYNLIFTGGDHIIRYAKSLGINFYNYLTGLSVDNYFSNSDRHFYFNAYFDVNLNTLYKSKIIGVPDDVKCVGIGDTVFRSRAGMAEEAWRYEFVGIELNDSTDKKENSDIIRGSFSPYLACENTNLDAATIVDIMVPNYSEANMKEYFRIRMDDSSVFNAISDRIDIDRDQDDYLVTNKFSIPEDNIYAKGYTYPLYRGDCYICQYTLRINRNFNDPSAPYNDEIVDKETWKENYDPDNTEKYEQINLGDVNAVLLGMWVTFKLRSSNNLNIRTLDGSFVDESAMAGHPRGFFPYFPMSTEGSYKHPESQIYNKGFTKTLSERWNFELPDVPYIKNWFGTRIMYSDIHINDAYKNGYRVFQGTHYRDYTRAYGEIVKLIDLNSNLLVVFEHGVALIRVNGQANASNNSTNYITVNNVLDLDPIIISDMFGSQWQDSILKVPTGLYVYGVDTVAKKIWRTDGNSLTCISDFKVQEFLNNNITLGERELTPKIGIRNVKTVYNAYKRDVLFTFYDNTYGFLERVWNLCWNELLEKFITFYSWVPSYMENINNIPFSFNRDTSKWIAKLGTSHTNNSFANGITLSNVVVESLENNNGEVVTNFKIPISYINKQGEWVILNGILSEDSRKKYIGVLSLNNRILPDTLLHYQISYSLERDPYGNYKKFEIVPLDGTTSGGVILPSDAMFAGAFMPLYALKFKEGQDEYLPILYKDNNEYIEVSNGSGYSFYTYYPLYSPISLLSEMYYRNKAKHVYADYDTNKVKLGDIVDGKVLEILDLLSYPIFKDTSGRRINLPREEMLNPDKIVTLLNIKATISIIDDENKGKLSDNYYNMKAGFQSGTSLINAGYYESTIAIIPKWNMLFLSTDFWKHGQAGLIDIADDIFPTYWYGKQHPFEFECVVVNDPSVHKIFRNLELVANKAKPESFHYEIIGEAYDFAKDKANMYFRQEALKALWQYNGADISYDRNFLKVLPRQLPKSADLPHKYYTRQDTINEIEDYYIHITYPNNTDYRHLSGGEIVYYPNRLEYRVWNHAMAVSMDDLSLDDARSIISTNCKYLEDRWKITINPILICYKNEYLRKYFGALILPQNSTWTDPNRPRLPIVNSPIPDRVYETILNNEGNVEIPEVLTNLGYTPNDMDTSNWLNDVNIYRYNFGEAQNRKEIDVRDKFLKIRIRYSGEELAIIDFLNTIYLVSFS